MVNCSQDAFFLNHPLQGIRWVHHIGKWDKSFIYLTLANDKECILYFAIFLEKMYVILKNTYKNCFRHSCSKSLSLPLQLYVVLACFKCIYIECIAHQLIVKCV